MVSETIAPISGDVIKPGSHRSLFSDPPQELQTQHDARPADTQSEQHDVDLSEEAEEFKPADAD